MGWGGNNLSDCLDDNCIGREGRHVAVEWNTIQFTWISIEAFFWPSVASVTVIFAVNIPRAV
jgi:hypothetical protein